MNWWRVGCGSLYWKCWNPSNLWPKPHSKSCSFGGPWINEGPVLSLITRISQLMVWSFSNALWKKHATQSYDRNRNPSAKEIEMKFFLVSFHFTASV